MYVLWLIQNVIFVLFQLSGWKIKRFSVGGNSFCIQIARGQPRTEVFILEILFIIEETWKEWTVIIRYTWAAAIELIGKRQLLYLNALVIDFCRIKMLFNNASTTEETYE